MIVTLGQGTHQSINPPRNVTTRTLDPALAVKKALAYFTDSTFAAKGPDPVLSPRISPDGTRLALRSKQIWAARRNMSLPPQFTDIGGQQVADTTARVYFTMLQGLNYTFSVIASDPESDPLTYAAYFLQLGMTFAPATRTFWWTPPAGTAGHTYYVRFQVGTASGGTDAIIAVIDVRASLGPNRAALLEDATPIGPNPTRGRFVLATPYVRGADAELSVYDVSGRRIATIRGPSGSRLEWDGRNASGAPALPGTYFYTLRVAELRHTGKIAVLR